ncbi:Rad4 transglutaminase-like domain-containing protein [Truncatella angustata]|uniref:Rad4 transglutaminase-like domain-containing protein n=1 Tax=Truncatella angustata TaxID=152316 RepID=A0A9P8UWD8_9PEZI|nr:Rad4 transglutaminase-like domain-containing protein [Truncatella angustata]KAH6659408.1 Rad4 transglutaminase-like domain-containing protein [Truncatella angustata]
MPPHLPRKRMRSATPEHGDKTNKVTKKGQASTPKAAVAPPRRSTLFDDLDAGSKGRSAEKTKSAIQQMVDDDDEDDSSSLSSLSDSDIEFEDVPTAKRQKVAAQSEDDDDDEDIEFEDVPNHEPQPEAEPVISGDLELTLFRNNHVPLASEMSKKGPSKREKIIRNGTHCIHVQFLLWHNALRNSWLCDPEVQAVMISHIPPRLWDEVDRWRQHSGLATEDEREQHVSPVTKKGVKGKAQPKGKANTRSKGKPTVAKPTRDWGDAADRLEKGAPNMSHGDPLFRLMKSLSSWWKQRFQITAPGLRKFGYMDVRRLAKWRQSFEEGEHDPERFGEKITDLEDFRRHAQMCEGSRDVGAQLFTALLRGLGLDARMVANLQSLGFGWNKSEEADEEKTPGDTSTNGTATPVQTNGKKAQEPKKATKTRKTPARPASRRTRKSDKDALKMDLDDSDEYAEAISEDSDDDSVIDVTADHTKPRPAPKVYDKDLDFPHYWTEVLSPVTHKWVPVDAIVKSVIGTNRELIESIEPRGAKADKAKQIMAYVVAHSRDGTAKDVTVRYLRKQLFPGRTKGTRMGIEKIPIYNKHGKVKHYEQFDWFKFVLSGYVRGSLKHPLTELDQLEDVTDLKPAVPEKKEVKEGEETLQYYKSSKEYVLQRHLKREEALLPSAEPVKVFRNKVKGGKIEEEDVYSRKDVVAVKSAETWHKQGRAPVPGAEPRKHAPYRAATTNRRREIAEAEARTGEKVLQPLYSEDQTDWIIPPPIENGVIPKNAYGNIDMFAEHMCPEGAVHIPYRGGVRVCKRMGIDYAEAVVGFEFGHRMAVPVIRGVVVAEEYEDKVVEEMEKDEAERQRKEDEKKRKLVLATWRKLLMGMRVAARIKQDYGHLEDKEIPRHVTNGDTDGNEGEGEGGFMKMAEQDEDMGGGFLPEGYDEEEPESEQRQTSTYFPVTHGDDGHDQLEVDHGGYEEKSPIVRFQGKPVNEQQDEDGAQVHGDEEAEGEVQPAPQTRRRAAQLKSKATGKVSTRRRSRRKIELSDEDDDNEDDDFELSD